MLKLISLWCRHLTVCLHLTQASHFSFGSHLYSILVEVHWVRKNLPIRNRFRCCPTSRSLQIHISLFMTALTGAVAAPPPLLLLRRHQDGKKRRRFKKTIPPTCSPPAPPPPLLLSLRCCRRCWPLPLMSRFRKVLPPPPSWPRPLLQPPRCRCLRRRRYTTTANAALCWETP